MMKITIEGRKVTLTNGNRSATIKCQTKAEAEDMAMSLALTVIKRGSEHTEPEAIPTQAAAD